jgi:hypothetical protein
VDLIIDAAFALELPWIVSVDSFAAYRLFPINTVFSDFNNLFEFNNTVDNFVVSPYQFNQEVSV